ncbi:MAG: CapA family protein [Oscillospiraceae bacterium]|nr:CapA family protein [Oscillospiraceae bacterium]
MTIVKRIAQIAVCYAALFCAFFFLRFYFPAEPELPLEHPSPEPETLETSAESEPELEIPTFVIYSPQIVEEIGESPAPLPAVAKYYKNIPKREIVICAVGDTTLASESRKGYAGSFYEYFDLYGPGYFMENVAHIFAESDFAVANLECALTDNLDPNIKRAGQYNYRGYATYTSILSAGGIGAVNLSNNHSYDYSETGYNDTIAALEAAGIGYFGNGDVFICEIGGIKVGFVSTIGYGTADIKQGLDYLASQEVEVKIVTFHWGIMDQRVANASQVAAARYAIDCGADLVIGHHPHVLQGTELYKGRYIAYSIGNFIFDGNVISDVENRTSVILKAKFALVGSKVVDCQIELVPIFTISNFSRNNFRPMLAEGAAGEEILAKIRARSG